MILSQDMRILEARSGIPRLILMENAGRAVCKAIRQKFDLNIGIPPTL